MPPEPANPTFFSRNRSLVLGASGAVGLAAVLAASFLVLPSRRSPEENFAVVRVLYGTDRASTASKSPAEIYGSLRGPMAWGYCDVSIPRDHRMGELEEPSVLKLEFREDPEKHIILLYVAPTDRPTFLREASGALAEDPRKEAFVFVHGYNVTFEDAARRTAQMKYDLGFRGAAFFFTWPSKATYQGYPADEAAIEWSTPDLLAFLKDVAGETGAETVHVIAHSMGNRGAAAALAEIAQGTDPALKSKFREIVLTAPDIDRDVFVRDIAPRLGRLGGRITLYASSHDKALLASKEFHAYPRAGELSAGPLIVEGVDSIDASAVDTSFLGHSYFAENASVLSDLYYVITPTPPIPTQNRFALEAIDSPIGRYWRIKH